MSDKWVWICDWGKFQHYTDRNPKWIKNYLELLGKEDYLDLTSHRRGLLHGIWMSFAVSRGRLRADTRRLSSRLRIKVTTKDLEALNDAGWIEILDSTTLAERLQDSPLTLALARADAGSREQQQNTSTSKGSDGSTTTPGTVNGSTPDTSAADNTLEAPRESEVEAAGATLKGWDPGSFGQVMPLAAQITRGRFQEVVAEVGSRRRIKNQPGLLVHLLQIAVHEARVAAVTNAVAESPLSPTEQARRNPEVYIPAMAQHLTEHDLRRYLLDYVKDETQHDALTELWQEAREKVPA